MSDLEVLVGVAGFGITVLVVAAMILITPRGQVDLHEQTTEPQGADLSRAPAADGRARIAPRR